MWDLTFRETCANGHEGIARWLHSLGGVDIHAEEEDAFRRACNFGHEGVARWLASLDHDENHDQEVDIHVREEEPFCLACWNGHEKIAVWLYAQGLEEITRIETLSIALCGACKNGHLGIAVWLHDLNMLFDPLYAVRMTEAFCHCCMLGYYDTARVLYTWGVADVHFNNDFAFRSACIWDHLSLAQWLYSLGGVDLHADSNELFVRADIPAHIKAWLLSLEQPPQQQQP
jgi:hypothetical protein